MTGPRKLTSQESGRLGGLTAADRMSPEQRARRASKGGAAVVEQRGKAHMTRLAHKRWGRLQTTRGSGTDVPRGAHNAQIAGSTPAPATNTPGR